MSSEPKDQDSTISPLTIGRYQVTDRLGEGGMGTVYLARDPSLERFVAVKVMRRGFDKPDLRERFVREARAVASLRHPCIVTLFEYGDHHGQPFIVMEYIAGKTLADMFTASAPMSLPRRLQLAEDLCRGLHHAHKAGIVHRDIKPANIMVDGEGTLKILDFGIAKLGQPGLTQLNALVGTPKYMSPEQVLGQPVTRRSDIFSVGLVCYELLAGRPAFDGNGPFAVMDAIANRTPTPLGEILPDLDPRIIRVVDKALEKDVDRRYQDLGQMRRDVERLRMELAVAQPTPSSSVRIAPPQDAQLEELGRRRRQQIAANLESSDRAFELGDYQAALGACEDVLILDPLNARAIEGLRRAQAAVIEQRALGHLQLARQLLEQSELEGAHEQLQAAFALAPNLTEALDLQRQVDAARQQFEERSREIMRARDRARIRFTEGAFESAIQAANQVLASDPTDSEALHLKAEALAALDDRLRRQELDRRARVLVDEARRLGALDRFADARSVLGEPTVADHPVVAQTRALLEVQHAEFQRLESARAAEGKAQLATTIVAVTPSTPRPPTPRPATEVPSSPSAPDVAAHDRWILFPPGMTVEHRTSMRRKPKPAPRPFVDKAIAGERAGERPWLGGDVFVKRKPDHDSVGFATSIGTHLVLGGAIVLVVLFRPLDPPPVKDTALSMVQLVSQPPPPAVDPPPSSPKPKTLPPTTRPPASVQPILTPQPVPVPSVQPSLNAEPASVPLTAPLGISPESPPPAPPPPPIAAVAIGALQPVSEEPVDDFDDDPKILTQVQPKVGVGASGVVRVRVLVLTTGRVSRVEVLDENTPYREAVMTAAAQCTFRAARRRGRPVAVWTRIDFKLGTNK